MVYVHILLKHFSFPKRFCFILLIYKLGITIYYYIRQRVDYFVPKEFFKCHKRVRKYNCSLLKFGAFILSLKVVSKREQLPLPGGNYFMAMYLLKVLYL